MLQEPFSPCGFRAETANKQTQNPIPWLGELHCQLNPQPHRVTAVKLRSLIVIYWGTVTWNVNVHENTEPLSCDGSHMPVEAASPSLQGGTFIAQSQSLSQRLNPALPEEITKASPEAGVMLILPRTHPLHLSLKVDLQLDSNSSKLLIIKYNVWPMKKYTTIQKNYLTFLIYTYRNVRNICEKDTKVLDNG